ncbi:MAG: hypothetical protein WA610_11635 [Thermodesulfovibrionales bacterium]
MKKIKIMCCRFLDSSGSSCSADSEAYIPGQFELRTYCRQQDHKKCPFYQNLHVWTFLNSDLF